MLPKFVIEWASSRESFIFLSKNWIVSRNTTDSAHAQLKVNPKCQRHASTNKISCSNRKLAMEISCRFFQSIKRDTYSVSQKSSPPPKTFCDIFTCGEPV